MASSRPGHCQCHAGVAGYGNQLSDLLILRFEVAYETVSFFCGRIEDTDDTINFQDDILTLSMTAQTKHRSTAKQTAIMQYVNPSSDSFICAFKCLCEEWNNHGVQVHNIYGEYRASHPVNKLVFKRELLKEEE